jgi:uncharacterized protein (TIRG00374 family)
MSFRSWVSIITLILLAVIIYFGRKEIFQVWHLLGSVNPWILSLLIPIQLFSYFAVGNTVFSYLRAKGDLSDVSRWQMMRIALELNFVNHIIPSGGVSGFSYLSWLLTRYKVSVSRSTMAQIVRFVTFFLSFIILLVISVTFLALDNAVSRTTISMSLILVITAIVGVFVLVFAIEDHKRLTIFSAWIVRSANHLYRVVTFGKKRKLLDYKKVENFFIELHQDYLAIKHDKKILLRPFLWSMCANLADMLLILVAFLALGEWVSPAALFIAYGLAGVSSIVSVTPGGAGVYEAVMIAFLASTGVVMSVAVAGTLLARVILLVGTILFGYVFYQMTILRYGKYVAPRIKSDNE